MARYYSKGYFESIGQEVKYSVKMELNGSAHGILHYIIEKTTDESVRLKAQNELSGNGTNHTERNETSHKERRTSQNEQGETTTNQIERMRLMKRIEGLEQHVRQQQESIEQTSRMKEESEQERVYLERENKDMMDEIEQLRAELQALKQKHIEQAKAWIRDVGRYVLSSPNVKFFFVITLVCSQAFLFAMLEEKALAGINIKIEFLAAFFVGILFEASGFMIARQFPSGKWDGISTRDWWLIVFFVFQLITNNCLFEPWNAGSITEAIAREIVSLAAPIGLLAYSFLYFQNVEK